MARSWLGVLLASAACRQEPKSDSEPADVDADTDSDTDADSDTDTDTDTDVEPVLEITDPTTSLHPTVGSIVVVGWDQSEDATVHLEFSVDPGIWSHSPERALVAGPHEEWLLGVPFDTDVTWRIVAVDGADVVTTADTVTHSGPRPPELPETSLISSDPARYDASMPWVLAAMTYDGDWTQVVDRQGRTVWALAPEFRRATLYPRVSYAGDAFLIDHNSYFGEFDGGVLSEVVEVKIDGSIVRTWATPGLHHPYTQLPDGSIAYARTYEDFTEDVTAVDLNGTVTQLFDCDAWLETVDPDAFCNANALHQDPVTGHLLLTAWTLRSTVEFDPTTGDAVRWFGGIPQSYTFDPPESAMVYPHGATLTDAGTLLLSDSAYEVPAPMVVREYTIDDATRTLTELWTFGVADEVIGDYGFGDVFRMPNGNTQQNCGVPRLREVTPSGEVVWDMEWVGAFPPVLYRTTPFADLYAMAPERL